MMLQIKPTNNERQTRRRVYEQMPLLNEFQQYFSKEN